MDPSQPRRLKHAYVRRIVSVIDTTARAGQPLRMLHLGGGALTIARYVAATRPESTQVVVERHAVIDELVREVLPPPTAIRTVIADAATAVATFDEASFDVIINDVYDGARMPSGVAGANFLATVARLLAPSGCYLVNVTDLPPAVYSRIYAATLRLMFGDIIAIAEQSMLRGRRYGNVVLAASQGFAPEQVARVVRGNARDEARAQVLHGTAVDDFIGGVGPVRD